MASFGAYSLAYLLLFPSAGIAISGLTIAPVAIVSWLVGLPWGLLVGGAGVTLNYVLDETTGLDGLQTARSNLPGILGTLLISGIAGMMGDLVRQTQAQARRLQAEIAQRVQTEELLVRAKEAAEAADRAKSAFLAVVSHELRTPLTAILGFADLLLLARGETPLEQVRKELQHIRDSGQHLLALVNDVLDLTTIQSGDISLTMGQIDVAGLVQMMGATFRPLAEQAGNTLHTEIDGGLPRVRGDTMRLQQVLANLLHNANKFTHGGSITLRGFATDHDGRQVCIEVADTGIGIGAEDLRHIFNPFTQVDASHKRRYGGVGLGLTISKGLCELMGGTISVTSEAGGGTTFTLRLPALAADVEGP